LKTQNRESSCAKQLDERSTGFILNNQADLPANLRWKVFSVKKHLMIICFGRRKIAGERVLTAKTMMANISPLNLQHGITLKSKPTKEKKRSISYLK
jgi:hypothetical protein